MKLSRNQKSVTNGPWSVSCTTGTDIQGAILRVARHIGQRIYPGDADGRLFASSDVAFQFAFERGYTKQFVTPWCSHCRTEHQRKGAYYRPDFNKPIKDWQRFDCTRRDSFCPVLQKWQFD